MYIYIYGAQQQRQYILLFILFLFKWQRQKFHGSSTGQFFCNKIKTIFMQFMFMCYATDLLIMNYSVRLLLVTNFDENSNMMCPMQYYSENSAIRNFSSAVVKAPLFNFLSRPNILFYAYQKTLCLDTRGNDMKNILFLCQCNVKY